MRKLEKARIDFGIETVGYAALLRELLRGEPEASVRVVKRALGISKNNKLLKVLQRIKDADLCRFTTDIELKINPIIDPIIDSKKICKAVKLNRNAPKSCNRNRNKNRNKNCNKSSEKTATKSVAQNKIPKSSRLWSAYRSAYKERYGVSPVRNAKVNSMLCQIVDRLGDEDACLTAHYFLKRQNAYYIKRGHSLNIFLNDCEHLSAQRRSGKTAYAFDARAAENIDRTKSQLERIDRGVL